MTTALRNDPTAGRRPGTRAATAPTKPTKATDPDAADGTELTADVVVFASGYAANLARVPYLSGVLDQVVVRDGFPELTEGFETSLPGLFVTGFAATRDFGPFYGFTKGCPSAAHIAVEEMLR
jgi:FAD-dependent urate hydroxylase